MDKHSVKIIRINWMNRENPEAEVLFEINGQQLWSFCHPCTLIEGEKSDVTFGFGDSINDERVVGSYVYFSISRLDIHKA